MTAPVIGKHLLDVVLSSGQVVPVRIDNRGFDARRGGYLTVFHFGRRPAARAESFFRSSRKGKFVCPTPDQRETCDTENLRVAVRDRYRRAIVDMRDVYE